jgi:hypothetical protein
MNKHVDHARVHKRQMIEGVSDSHRRRSDFGVVLFPLLTAHECRLGVRSLFRAGSRLSRGTRAEQQGGGTLAHTILFGRVWGLLE